MIHETFKTDLTNDATLKRKGKTFTYSFKHPTAINRFLAEEEISQGQRVRKFSIEAFANGKWTPLKDQLVEQGDGLTTIGHRRIVCFPTIKVTKLRFKITDSKAEPIIRRVGIYLAPET